MRPLVPWYSFEILHQGKKGKGSVIMERLICVLVGYVFGLIQTGYLYGKKNGVDLRKKGSGNAGTTNALRTMGWKAGGVTLLGDCFKCVAAVVVVHMIYGKTHTDMDSVTFYVCRNGRGSWT